MADLPGDPRCSFCGHLASVHRPEVSPDLSVPCTGCEGGRCPAGRGRCWYCQRAIVYEEGIPGAWRLTEEEDREAAFTCDGWFHGVHLPVEVS